ncbi:hypothetical protein D3C78_461210 [compost metagenome]
MNLIGTSWLPDSTSCMLHRGRLYPLLRYLPLLFPLRSYQKVGLSFSSACHLHLALKPLRLSVTGLGKG